MRKNVTRSRSRFRTSRLAWADVAKRNHLEARFYRPAHTGANWRWSLRATPNPRAIADTRKAEAFYKKFHGANAAHVEDREMEELPSVTVKLGQLRQVNYVRREGGQLIELYHVFKRPFPVLASNVEGTALFIIGGGYRIKDVGIVG